MDDGDNMHRGKIHGIKIHGEVAWLRYLPVFDSGCSILGAQFPVLDSPCGVGPWMSCSDSGWAGFARSEVDAQCAKVGGTGFLGRIGKYIDARRDFKIHKSGGCDRSC